MNYVKGNPKKRIFVGICITLLAIILSLFVYTGTSYGNQAKNALYLSAEFCGEYKIADGEWQPYVKGKHIPANRGDVTLKGYFNLFIPETGEVVGNAPEGVVIACYFNHIAIEIAEEGEDFRPLDAEINTKDEDMCGEMYIGYVSQGSEEIRIRLKNPHRFGNTFAVDDFLNNLSTYAGTDFERDVLNSGSTGRVMGIALILFAFMLLGMAAFSVRINAKGNGNLWLAGFVIIFAGVYFIFEARGVMFFSEVIKFNTRLLAVSMMLYMASLTALLALQLKGKSRLVGMILTAVAAVSIAAFMVASALHTVRFYDTLPYWAILQTVICLVMIVLLALRLIRGDKKEKTLSAFGILPMASFILDFVGTVLGLWQGEVVSKFVFVFLFFSALILIFKVVPQNMDAAIRARELETEKILLNAELADNRIAIMISQIQPHFIYNTLGTIEQLCITEPEAASKLVRNFSLYLRGNFSELDRAKPIMFSQEMKHVKHYTDIEQVRFPDMTIQYDLRSVEFLLPALSVQPLVENAIKHGLMGLEQGGIVTISAYETEEHYVVEVEDDGVGFDTSAEYDERKHIGIKNIRGRLDAMCKGSLAIESKVGKGTKATIRIPKEATESDSNNG